MILAPSAVLIEDEDAPGSEPGTPRSPAVLGAGTRGRLWDARSALIATVGYHALWSPVLVLSHDCELEKQFNERVEELKAQGVAEDEAIAAATADPTLDPFAVVAPILPYTAFEARRHAGMRAGQRIGILPLDQIPGDGADYVVDLFRPVTVAVGLLPQFRKVASLAPPSVGELRYKLSEAYAIRDLAVLAKIEALVGRTIVRAEALPKSQKKSALVLHLDDESVVHLEIRRPREDVERELTRQPGPGPVPGAEPEPQ